MSVAYRSPTIYYATDLDFDLSKSPKVKSDGFIGYPIYNDSLASHRCKNSGCSGFHPNYLFN